MGGFVFNYYFEFMSIITTLYNDYCAVNIATQVVAALTAIFICWQKYVSICLSY